MNLPYTNLLTEMLAIGLVVSLVTGFFFGFVLERAGFGQSTKLANQFYLRDMTVFKVMFTAVVTAMIGLVVAGGVGLVEVESLARGAASYTYLWPFLVAGLVLGIGFIISGYCPGTSIVGAASGNIDGLFTFAGVVLGTVVYGELYPFIGSFATSSNLEHLFLTDVTGLPRSVVALLVTLMAVGAFFGAEKLERHFTKDEEIKHPTKVTRRRRHAVWVGLGAAAAAGLVITFTSNWSNAATDTAPRQPRQITAEQLAERVVREPWRVRILDMRGEAAWTKARVPGSEPVERTGLEQLGLQYVEEGVDLVVIAGRTVGDLPGEISSYDGRILALRGGFPAWERFALREASPPADDATEEERARWAYRAALRGMLTGQAAAAPPPRAVRVVGPRPTTGGGCQ